MTKEDSQLGKIKKVSMAKISAVGLGTEIGKQILWDFKNYKITGFKPWGKGVGGTNHYNSSEQYKIVSQSEFRSQAQKIADFALKQMSAEDHKRTSETAKIGNEANPNENVHYENETGLPIDSENRNPWMTRMESQTNMHNINEDDDEKDEDYLSSHDGSSTDDHLDDFDDIEMGELQNSRAPFLSQYPTQNKLLAIFPLDGDVLDQESTQFEFINDNTAIQRLGKVPKERESCVSLIGNPIKDKPSKFGFTSVDLMVVDAEIQRRLKANNYQRDINGNIWEVRAVLQLPFKCQPQLYDKNGKALKSFRMQTNGKGFSWGFFWLLAWSPPKLRRTKRIGATMVKTISVEESSTWTEATYESKRKARKLNKASKH